MSAMEPASSSRRPAVQATSPFSPAWADRESSRSEARRTGRATVFRMMRTVPEPVPLRQEGKRLAAASARPDHHGGDAVRGHDSVKELLAAQLGEMDDLGR